MPQAPGPVDDGASVGDVVRLAMASGVERLACNEAVLRTGQGDTGEAVHQMRVATRRLRSDLRTFRSALDRRWGAELRAELGWLAALLGAVRDTDVLSQRLDRLVQGLAPGAQLQAKGFLRALAEQRARAEAALMQALDSDRHRTLVKRLAAATQTPPLISEADLGAATALSGVVWRTWQFLQRRVAALADVPTDEELHGVRIAAKRCRYAAEACVPLLGRPARRLARATKALQAVLGELNDASTAERWLLDRAQAADSPSAALATEELAAQERAAASLARSQWPEAWSRVAMAAADWNPAKGQ